MCLPRCCFQVTSLRRKQLFEYSTVSAVLPLEMGAPLSSIPSFLPNLTLAPPPYVGTNLGCHDQTFSITYANPISWVLGQSAEFSKRLAYLIWLWWMFKDTSEEHITNLSYIHYLLRASRQKVFSPWGQFKHELSLFLRVLFFPLPAGFLISLGCTCSLCRKSERRNSQCTTVLSHATSHQKLSFSKCICDVVVGCGIVQASLSLLLFSCLLITVGH